MNKPGMQRMKMRLALRHEGQFWNAYLALPDTMEGAKLIGSIVIGAITKDPEIKTAFMALMQHTLSLAAEEVTGQKPDDFIIEPAPEAERSGHS